MAYSEKLASRIRETLISQKKVEEKKMMGGLTFMVNGKMCVGIIKDELMVRIAPEMQDTALEREGCRRMEFTGRPLKGFLLVDETGMGTKRKLEIWVNLALDYNKSAKASKKGTLTTRTKK